MRWHGALIRDSQEKWRARHLDYPRQYRWTHPDFVQRNRQAQRRRDRQRRLQRLVKNNLALDLKRSAAEVWLLGPEAGPLAKNNVAFSNVLIPDYRGRPGAAGPQDQSVGQAEGPGTLGETLEVAHGTGRTDGRRGGEASPPGKVLQPSPGMNWRARTTPTKHYLRGLRGRRLG